MIRRRWPPTGQPGRPPRRGASAIRRPAAGCGATLNMPLFLSLWHLMGFAGSNWSWLPGRIASGRIRRIAPATPVSEILNFRPSFLFGAGKENILKFTKLVNMNRSDGRLKSVIKAPARLRRGFMHVWAVCFFGHVPGALTGAFLGKIYARMNVLACNRFGIGICFYTWAKAMPAV